MALQSSAPRKSQTPLWVGGCLVLLVLVVGVFWFSLTARQRAVKDQPGYKLALDMAHAALKVPPTPAAGSDPTSAQSAADAVKASLGDDFEEPGFLSQCDLRIIDGSTVITFTAAIKGTKGEGKIDVEAAEDAGTWRVRSGKLWGPDGRSFDFVHP